MDKESMSKNNKHKQGRFIVLRLPVCAYKIVFIPYER